MSINLSDLTSPNNQDIFAEITSAADFLDPIGKLENLSRGSNKGGHALQTVALNQPRALPLIKNPQGNLGGYLYIPDVSGNSATGPSVTIGANQTWQAEVDMVITEYGNYIKPLGGGAWTSGFSLLIYSDGRARVFSKSDVSNLSAVNSIPLNTPFNVKYGFNGSAIYIELNDQSLITTSTGSNQASVLTEDLKLQAQPSSLGSQGNYAIQKAKLTVNNAVVFDCDFNGSTSIRHGDTKWQASVGGAVSLTRAGNDPATIIKRSVLRFDGADDGLKGLFDQTISEFHYFAAYTVNGNGGETSGRVFEISSNDGSSEDPTGVVAGIGNGSDLAFYYSGWRVAHSGFHNAERGDFLHQLKFTNGSQVSKVNNADTDTRTLTTTVSSEEFSIGMRKDGATNYCLDLEYLALFPATITDAQADNVREYIRAKTQVYDLPTPIQNNYSVAFDGVDDFMTRTLPVLGDTHTLSAWFKTTASYGGAGSEGTLISYLFNGGDNSVLSVMNNKVGWSDFVDDNQVGTSTVNDGNWHHAVAVVTATTQKIYVDGVLETTTTNAYSAGTSFSHFALAKRANAPQRFFNGNIDEVAIWDSALTANEVKSIYNNGKPVDLSGQPELYSSANNLVAWWRMGDNDSGTGSTVTDNSINSYNGSLVNGPTFQTTTP